MDDKDCIITVKECIGFLSDLNSNTVKFMLYLCYVTLYNYIFVFVIFLLQSLHKLITACNAGLYRLYITFIVSSRRFIRS